jgi:hypothetical protein
MAATVNGYDGWFDELSRLAHKTYGMRDEFASIAAVGPCQDLFEGLDAVKGRRAEWVGRSSRYEA